MAQPYQPCAVQLKVRRAVQTGRGRRPPRPITTPPQARADLEDQTPYLSCSPVNVFRFKIFYESKPPPARAREGPHRPPSSSGWHILYVAVIAVASVVHFMRGMIALSFSADAARRNGPSALLSSLAIWPVNPTVSAASLASACTECSSPVTMSGTSASE